MKEKIALTGNLKVKQEQWSDSPCSGCSNTPCCRNLPLTSHRLESQRDFVSLILSSCYNGFYPALKDSGEWVIYQGLDCSFLDPASGKCSIHAAPGQSLVCKSYDAHNCWYVDAFSRDSFKTMIPFNTEMLIWFERKHELIKNRFDYDYNWSELCGSAFELSRGCRELHPAPAVPFTDRKLSFRKSRSEEFLFFPPYKRPESRSHFELLSFRLGFPGISLAVSDGCWAFMAQTAINAEALEMVRREYYPAVGHSDGSFSFSSLQKDQNPWSVIGEQWLILNRSELDVLVGMTVFDGDGKVRRYPTTAELLDALSVRNPDRAA